jgi:acetoin utilization deacetylase AcuC-like enzyme
VSEHTVRIFHCDSFTYPLPQGHRFPAEKYALLRARVAADLIPPGTLHVPHAATDDELLWAHDRMYLHKVTKGDLTTTEVRRMGLPWSPALVERSRRSVGGTIEACRAAIDDGLGISLSGGTHHAFREHGEGFCIFNDAAVAARVMQAEGCAERIAIVDCDVHQGNGTAAILADDPTIFTFSMHGAKNFPFHKERSDLDVELPDRTGDEAYLSALETGLRGVLARARADLVIYLAGADPFVGDTLGRLSLSKAGLAERDRMVFRLCRQASLPVAVAMAGGYARPIQDTVEIHFETVRIALNLCDSSVGDGTRQDGALL